MAKQAEKQNQFSAVNEANAAILASYSELKQAVELQQLCSSYKVESLSDYGILLTKDGTLKSLIDCQFYLKDHDLREKLSKFDSKCHVLICIGNDEVVRQIKSAESHEQVSCIRIPQSRNDFEIQIENIHNLQMQYLTLEKDLEEEEHLAAEEVNSILSISRELNGERNIPKLLNLILAKARAITKADAGSIYTIERRKNADDSSHSDFLRFRFTQNDSIVQNLSEFELPVNEKSIVGYSLVHKKTINIEDLYILKKDSENNPMNLVHDRSWDKKIGYETHSMLTIPMYDISHATIGVIQLINCKKDKNQKLKTEIDFSEFVTVFDPKKVEYAEIVAQQAGIALENAKMQEEIQNLFDSFVDASVTAIELRDPTTSGHSHRVADLTIDLAKKLSRHDQGTYKNISFDEDEIREIKYASLLHDFGKLGVREHVLVKSKKLYPNQFQLIEERFKLIRSSIEIEYLNKCIDFHKNPEKFPPGLSVEQFQFEKEAQIDHLDHLYDMVCKSNEPTVLEQGGFEMLNDIANRTFDDLIETGRPYLYPHELKALSVSRGSLTAEEFAEIQSHVTHTYEFLRKIPWGPKLANVPQIAAKHHEKLDGSGYPTSSAANDIPIQSRMMTISDIYDALTAADRPYKKAMPAQRAIDILEMEVKGGKIDSEIFDIFVKGEVYKVCQEEKRK